MSRLHDFPFLTAEEIANSPTVRDGWTAEKESKYRQRAIKIIFETAKHEPFPKMSAGTAALAAGYYLRFYTRRSLEKNSAFIIVCAALILAGKTNDEPRSLDALSVEVLKHWYGRDNPNVRSKLSNPEFLATLRSTVEIAELSLMITMDFDLNFELPYPYIARFTKTVPGLAPWRGNSVLQQFITSFCNDIFKWDPTMVLQYPGKHITLAAFQFYFKQRRVDPPPAGEDGAPWFVAQGLSQEAWKDISHRLVTRVYPDRRSKGGAGAGDSQGTVGLSTANTPVAAGGGGGGGGATSTAAASRLAGTRTTAATDGGAIDKRVTVAMQKDRRSDRSDLFESPTKKLRGADWLENTANIAAVATSGPLSMGPSMGGGSVRSSITAAAIVSGSGGVGLRLDGGAGASARPAAATKPAATTAVTAPPPPPAEDDDSDLEEGEVRD